MLYQYPNVGGFIHVQLGWDDRWHERQRHVSPMNKKIHNMSSKHLRCLMQLHEHNWIGINRSIERYVHRTFLVLPCTGCRDMACVLDPSCFRPRRRRAAVRQRTSRWRTSHSWAGNMPKQVFPWRNGHAKPFISRSFSNTLWSIYEDFSFRVSEVCQTNYFGVLFFRPSVHLRPFEARLNRGQSTVD